MAVQRRRKKRGLTVKALDSRPVVDDRLVPVWMAFIDLSRGRSSDMGTCHGIRYSDIQSYLDLAGILGHEQRSSYAHLISVLDRHFMEELRKKNDG